MIHNRRILLLLFIAALLCHSSACERRTQIELEGANPLIFTISGSGSLAVLTLYGPEREQARDPFTDTGAVWKIAARGGYFTGKGIEKLHSVTYGVVPEGYMQLIPEGDKLPPSLVEGITYSYWFDTTDAPHGTGCFQMRDGKPGSVNCK